MKSNQERDNCFFVTDLHGSRSRFDTLVKCILQENPSVVFMGGDLFPSSLNALTSGGDESFDFDYFAQQLESLQSRLKDVYPEIFIIAGNDDSFSLNDELAQGEIDKLWTYLLNRSVSYKDFTIFGYPFVPPTPFVIKDWEKYDVSRFVDPGCVSPEEGYRSVTVPLNEIKYGSIKKDLELAEGILDYEKLICLFHSPPYKCNLDRAALDGKMIDHVPLDVHVGSIAIREFFEQKNPYLGLHGHIHESARLTGDWKDIIGKTPVFTAAHDGSELSLIRFELDDLSTATRELL